MTVRRSSFVFSLLFAAALHAQSTPPPSGVVVPPITGYAGRYLDSAQTPNFQGNPTRTLRAQLVKVAPERGLILMKLSGSLFGVYNLHTFASRLTGSLSTGGHGEKYLPPDVFSVDPENPSSGWTTFATDGQERLFDFDYDDRGYFYLAYSIWGFGIVDSAGVKQSQVVSPPVYPLRILTVRDGANVRAIVSDASSTSVVYDVTNPATPVFLRTLPFGIVSYAKLASGGVAVVTGTATLQIYSNGSDLAAGNAPTQIVTPQPGFGYILVATDGITIFAAQLSIIPGGAAFLAVLTPSTGGYTETREAPRPGFLPSDLHYGAGYVALSGSAFLGSRVVLLFPANSTTATDLTAYFTSAYPPGPIFVQSIVPYASGRQTYLIAALFGVGDVFTLSASSAPAAIPAFTPAMLIALAIGIAAIAAWRMR
jgi:hypothetical protein